MSIIANITLHLCDDCGRVQAVQTEDDAMTFNANWFAGLFIDYCPKCKDHPANQERIGDDKRKSGKVANIVRSVEIEQREAAYGH